MSGVCYCELERDRKERKAGKGHEEGHKREGNKGEESDHGRDIKGRGHEERHKRRGIKGRGGAMAGI